MEFKDHVAIITGAARGIGAATAWAFAKRGATSVIVDINTEGAEKVAAEIKAKGFNAEAYTVDVSDDKAVTAMVEEVFKKHGRIDILVNNAYISGGYSIVTETSQETWDKVIAVNLTGSFKLYFTPYISSEISARDLMVFGPTPFMDSRVSKFSGFLSYVETSIFPSLFLPISVVVIWCLEGRL